MIRYYLVITGKISNANCWSALTCHQFNYTRIYIDQGSISPMFYAKLLRQQSWPVKYKPITNLHVELLNEITNTQNKFNSNTAFRTAYILDVFLFLLKFFFSIFVDEDLASVGDEIEFPNDQVMISLPCKNLTTIR